MSGRAFILLTDLHAGPEPRCVYVDAAAIETVKEASNGAYINTTGAQRFSVAETAEDVMARIEFATDGPFIVLGG